MNDDKLKCGRRKCGWTGLQRELAEVPSPRLKRMNIAGCDRACPRCGCKTFVVVELAAGAKDGA